VERERVLERLRARAEALEKLELREPEDLLRASLLLRGVWEEVANYAARARRYEIFDQLKEVEGSERALHATYLTVRLNGGGEEVVKRAQADLEGAREALRKILANL
jgi:hypothetical protein